VEVPDCVYLQADGSRTVASRYLRELPYKSDGLAAIWITSAWAYVNRRGTVIISGVASYDNGPQEFHDGLVMFVKNNKYGFADRSGKVVIPPIYDGALNFEEWRTKVCLGCVYKCMDQHCEHRMLSGGEWLTISKTGEVLK
jgi:hypothetical protein